MLLSQILPIISLLIYQVLRLPNQVHDEEDVSAAHEARLQAQRRHDEDRPQAAEDDDGDDVGGRVSERRDEHRRQHPGAGS